MGNLIDIYDGGIQNHRGRKVGVIIFRISNNEGAPEEIIGYCHPDFRTSIIKNLKRLMFQKEDHAHHDGGREESS